MKGVILAGGTGSRLAPITKIINKHLLPVYDRPMIFYPLDTLKKAGLKDILIVTNPHHLNDFHEILGDGSAQQLNINYVIQEKPGGIAEAVGLAEKFANDKIVCILGDNVLPTADISQAVQSFRNQKSGAKIFLKKVTDTKPYGIAEIVNGKIVAIEEKPENPKSNLAVIGLYMYDADIFNIIQKVQPSHRNEMEITCVNNYYVEQGLMSYEIIESPWIDAGESFESLYQATKLVMENCIK